MSLLYKNTKLQPSEFRFAFGNAYRNTGNAYLNTVNAYLNTVNAYRNTGNIYLDTVNAYRNTGQTHSQVGNSMPASFHNTGKKECSYTGSVWETTRVADANYYILQILQTFDRPWSPLACAPLLLIQRPEALIKKFGGT